MRWIDPPRPNLVPVVLTIGLLLATSAVVLEAAGSAEIREQVREDAAEAEAYCEAVAPDSGVVIEQAMFGHGGYHCDRGPEESLIHLHAIPDRYQERALAAERNGTDLGWNASTAAQHASEHDGGWLPVPLPGRAVV